MNKFQELNLQRRQLREKIIAKMKTNPTIELSETLRKVDDDIEFWESQTDHSIAGCITTLQKSLNRS